jgi:hypothetical protein
VLHGCLCCRYPAGELLVILGHTCGVLSGRSGQGPPHLQVPAGHHTGGLLVKIKWARMQPQATLCSFFLSSSSCTACGRVNPMQRPCTVTSVLRRCSLFQDVLLDCVPAGLLDCQPRVGSGLLGSWAACGRGRARGHTGESRGRGRGEGRQGQENSLSLVALPTQRPQGIWLGAVSSAGRNA